MPNSSQIGVRSAACVGCGGGSFRPVGTAQRTPRETAGHAYAALRDAENSFVHLRRRAALETYELPFSSMMFAALTGSGFDALWFGDCAALVERPDGTVELVGDAIKKKARESGRVAALAATLGENAAATTLRDAFLPALRAARNLVNTERGGWLFGPDARAAGHVASSRISCSVRNVRPARVRRISCACIRLLSV